MAGPPADIPASELWRKLSEAPRPSIVIDFPRKGPDGEPLGKLRVQVLTLDQHDEARLRAHTWLKDKKKIPSEDVRGPSIQEVYGDAVARELLAMACLSVEPIAGTETSPRYARIFPTAEAIGQKLSADEVNVLFTAYTMAQHRFGPYEATIDGPDELNAWIKRLTEGASAFPLAQCSWHQLVELSMSLAERAYSLSAVLESLHSTLPASLASSLASWGIGTCSFTAQHASDTVSGSLPEPPGGWTREPEPAATESEEPEAMPVPMTTEDAARAAERLHRHGR